MNREEYKTKRREIAHKYKDLVDALYEPVHVEVNRLYGERDREIAELGPAPTYIVHIGDHTQVFDADYPKNYALEDARHKSGDWLSAAWIDDRS